MHPEGRLPGPTLPAVGGKQNPDPVPRVEVSTSVGSLRIGYSTNFIQAVPPSSMVPTIRMGDADRASASFPLP